MSYCPHCGAPLNPHAKFCSACGASLAGDATQPERQDKAASPHAKPGDRRKVLALVAINLMLVGAIVAVLLQAGKPNTPEPAKDTAIEETSEVPEAPTQEGETEEEADVDTPEEPHVTKEEPDFSEGEQTQEQAAEAQHAQLRADAESAGMQVLEGTIHVFDGGTTADVLGTRDAFYGNGEEAAEAEQKSFYVLLQLDQEQQVYVTGFSGEPFTRDYSFIKIGQNTFNRYSGTYDNDSASPWTPYDGKRVCVAADSFYVSEGLSVINVAQTSDAELLYTEDEATQDSPINGWWNSAGQSQTSWWHITGDAVYAYRRSLTDDTYAHSETVRYSVRRFEAGDASDHDCGGYQLILNGGSWLCSDDNQDLLVCQNLDGSGYSMSSTYGRAAPPAELEALAAQVE